MEKVLEDFTDIEMNSDEVAGYFKVTQILLFESAKWLIYFVFVHRIWLMMIKTIKKLKKL